MSLCVWGGGVHACGGGMDGWVIRLCDVCGCMYMLLGGIGLCVMCVWCQVMWAL